MSRAQLVEMARKDLEHGRNGTLDQVEEIVRIPVENYYDQARWEAEVQKVFRRIPLVLAATAELPVASIGSTTMTRRSCKSSGTL